METQYLESHFKNLSFVLRRTLRKNYYQTEQCVTSLMKNQ